VTPGNNPDNEYEYDYWDHVDFAIDAAAKNNLYIGLLPTWGDKVAHMWRHGPIIFTSANAYGYVTGSSLSMTQQRNSLLPEKSNYFII
jgi:hypothetical protein